MCTVWVTFEFGTMTSGHTLRALMAVAKFSILQAQAIAGFSSLGRQLAIPRSLEYRSILYKTTFVLGKLWRDVSDKNYELLYSVKAHVPTHREGRKELGKNGSSDLVDLGTFRLIRRSCVWGIHLVWCTIGFAEQLKCLCISEHVQSLHFKLEKRNYQVQIFSLECKFGRHETEKSSTIICNIGLKLKQNQTAKSKVWLMFLNSKLILWVSYITNKLRTDYYNNQSQVYIMYIAN